MEECTKFTTPVMLGVSVCEHGAPHISASINGQQTHLDSVTAMLLVKQLVGLINHLAELERYEDEDDDGPDEGGKPYAH